MHETAFLCQGGLNNGVFGRFPYRLDKYTADNGIFLSRWLGSEDVAAKGSRRHRPFPCRWMPFAAHSWYFRNALVRANYFNRERRIVPDLSYLERFLRNLVLGEQNELKNRYLHISAQSFNPTTSKGQIGTLNVTLEERAVLNCILADAKITQQEIAERIRKSPRTVKRIMASLSERQIIVRKNGKRDGWWEVLV